MNLNILSIATMITITKFWLLDAVARAIIDSHELGRAYRGQLQLVYDLLRMLELRRGNAKAELRALVQAMTALDFRHDNKARAVFYHLLALRAGTDDPALAAECDALLRRFFPKRLSIVTWSYMDEAGWAESMNQQMTPELRARLATITVGEQTLADLFDAWLQAGMELGNDVVQRNRLEAAVSPGGASDEAISIREARSRWIHTVQTFLNSLGMMGLSEEQLEKLLAPLETAIAQAVERQARGEDPSADPDQPAETPEPTPETGDAGNAAFAYPDPDADDDTAAEPAPAAAVPATDAL